MPSKHAPPPEGPSATQDTGAAPAASAESSAPSSPSPQPLDHLRASDMRAVAQLATQATLGVATIVEGVHQAVLQTMGASGTGKGKTRGITGLVYRAVQGVTEVVGQGVEAALEQLEPMLESLVDAPPETPEREAVLAALNGVMGDTLAAADNPLATAMTLRYQGQALHLQAQLPIAKASGKVLLLIHGLCMNDLQWLPSEAPPGPVKDDASAPSDHGAVLAAELGYTPIYLRYNTGLHTSQNGHQLATQLEQLLDQWPVPVEELSVVVHSMGGLVIRSAVYYARLGALRWPDRLKNIVFLGTPHHGAPLERAGNWVDIILDSTPYSRPFAKLGQLRSAGITDLRYGFVRESDWADQDRFKRKPDGRQPLQLPQEVACFTVAATLAKPRSLLAERLVGDGLVPLRSALGQHDHPEHNLHFAKDRQTVVYRMNHMEILLE
jgi:pimeloyl-ACP methyl ester carboxylesterase